MSVAFHLEAHVSVQSVWYRGEEGLLFCKNFNNTSARNECCYALVYNRGFSRIFEEDPPNLLILLRCFYVLQSISSIL